MNPEQTWRKFSDLKEMIRGMGKAVIAFSGGVDSLLLLNAAFENGGGQVIAVTIASPFFPRRELDMALELASSLTPEHLILEKIGFSDPRIFKNPRERCYYCKKELFAEIKDKVYAAYGTACVLDGTNHDDLPTYRPGMEALKELDVLSPLREIGFSKEEVRFVLAAKGFASWNKPPSACLATRIPHGEVITEDKLTMIEAAEDFLL
ncbi:MAG: ATP-dependent sacrificial sulfur transferase LarE, partial [Syntrophales bacterium]